MALINRFDAKLQFGESGAFGAAGTVTSANVIQMDKADPGRFFVDVQMTVAAAGGTNATFAIQGSNDNSTYVTVAQSAAIATASLTANAHFDIGVPDDFNYKYMRVVAVTTGTHTAGKFNATLDTYKGV